VVVAQQIVVVVVVVIDVVAGGGVSVVKIVAAVVVQVAHIALTAMIVRDAAGIDCWGCSLTVPLAKE